MGSHLGQIGRQAMGLRPEQPCRRNTEFRIFERYFAVDRGGQNRETGRTYCRHRRGGSASDTTGIEKILPAEARRHLPLYGSTLWPASTTASAPIASATRIRVPAFPGSEISAATASSRGESASTSSSEVSGTEHAATSPTGGNRLRQRLCGTFGHQVHLRVGQKRTESGLRGFGGEDLGDESAPQPGLDEIRSLGEKACGAASSRRGGAA